MNFIFAIPLVLNILAIIGYRRWFWIVAVLVLPLTVLAAYVDGQSASQKGNLTGLVTLFIGGPAVVVLALSGLGNLIQDSRPAPAGKSRPGADEPVAVRVARDSASGAALAMSGLILFGACSVFFKFGEFFFAIWMGPGALNCVAWAIVAAIGAVIGGRNSLRRVAIGNDPMKPEM
jgi:peptidoglycan/LPS O-acetylase OafA/YrhL